VLARRRADFRADGLLCGAVGLAPANDRESYKSVAQQVRTIAGGKHALATGAFGPFARLFREWETSYLQFGVAVETLKSLHNFNLFLSGGRSAVARLPAGALQERHYLLCNRAR
jgi:hypothetical protein